MIAPHEYQKEAVRALNASFKTGNRALLVAPPGIGKTVKAALWASQHVGAGRGLFLCHENRILEQAQKEFRQVLGEVPSLGVFHGEQKVFDEVDICFASFQTFRHWKDAFFPDEFLFVIVDESHHAGAPTFQPVIEYFTPRYLLGMTATPNRADDKNIRDIFGPEVVNISLEEAIVNGWLTPFEYHIITDNLHTVTLRRLVREELGEERRVSLAQLNESIFIELRDEQVAERIMGFNKKTIIFCERIEHAELFSAFIPGSKPYHTGRGYKENEETLQSFRDGALQYILAVDKLNEGIDIPDAEVIVFYRNTDSERIFLQQLGRGARKKPGKEKYIVLDFVSNIHRLLALKEMVENIERAKGEKKELDRNLIRLSGNGFDFRFTAEQLSIFEILERMNPKHVSDYPELAREYSDKNELPADKVMAGTANKLWWKCLKCGHEWQASGNNRFYNRNSRSSIKGTGCPACINKTVTPTNNLAVTHPELAQEYSEKNKLPADKVNIWTAQKLWWKCTVCGHEWQVAGRDRVAGHTGCPACAHLVAAATNNLAVTHPELAKEYSKKNKLPPEKIVAGTHKKLWWKCSKCGHEWQAPGRNRLRGTGCPACAGSVITITNNLMVTHPNLAKEYSSKNNVPADSIIAGTSKKLWWECSICGYEWQASGHHRVGSGTGCPACANRVVTPKNNLTVTHPELAKEYSKKNKLPPEKIVAGTHKKLWWKCSKCGHKWRATGSSRILGSGCPMCARKIRAQTRRKKINSQ